MKQYMVVETFLPGCKEKVYERFHEQGRMLPEGLAYLNSWLEKDGDRCFQLMETDDRSLFQVWFEHWTDLIAIEVIELGKKPKPESNS
jgi:uncharacterized protein DUF3303